MQYCKSVLSVNFNFRVEKFLIHEANVLKSDPVTLLFYAGKYSTAKAEFLCEIVKKFVAWNFSNFHSFSYFNKIQSTEFSIIFPLSFSVANGKYLTNKEA